MNGYNASPRLGTAQPFENLISVVRRTLNQWNVIDQQPGPTTVRSPPDSMQEFTFPSRGQGNRAPAAVNSTSSSHMGQVVDGSAVGVISSQLEVPQWARSESDGDQLSTEQQRHHFEGVTSDVLPVARQPQLNPNFTFGAKPNNSYPPPDLNPVRRIKKKYTPLFGHRRSNAITATVGWPSGSPFPPPFPPPPPPRHIERDFHDGKTATCLSLLFQLVMDKDQRARARLLSGDDAQVLVDYLDLVCRRGFFPPAQEGRRTLSLLGKLAKSAGVFPRRYLLQEVKHHPEPVAGGGFAEVFQGEYRGRRVCVKAIRAYQKQEQEEILKATVQELILWAHLHHKNIVPFIGIYFLGSRASRICLISPWMDNGNLRDYLNKFPQVLRMPLICDVVEGLFHLHSLHIVHRDLKTQNVLVSDSGRALIADFGLSFVLATTAMTSTGGTSRFIAPEILLEESKPTWSCDIWSFACLCYEVLTDKVPFYQYKDFRVTRALMDKEIPLRPGPEPGVGRQELNDQVWQILVNCWGYIPEDRPNCEEIRQNLKDMNIQGNQRVLEKGAGKSFWEGAIADDDIDYIFESNVEWPNDDFYSVQVETILRRVQDPP